MERNIVYILTDSNRAYLEVGQCTDIVTQINVIKDAKSALFPNAAKLTNLVYIEVFQTAEQAQARATQMQQFTRMQREKLIRLKNPNWLNLYHGFIQENKHQPASFAQC
ncbi:GIY-YIG nuclease family protein [Sphingobacterium psychroaquaticum]|uniref:GIY-YIG nuclease family protein n=1 Tax=Sphingobacterium psychroaquaticum TaxID=561061 RepID=UPI001068DC6A|nr:GIY-YIG nuclease family protein [Sphingobacterium psychroaquaticum]QBQ41513.1 GIY-YIG nuclease family protein [Sphingobacterium psychroaquaticum]